MSKSKSKTRKRTGACRETHQHHFVQTRVFGRPEWGCTSCSATRQGDPAISRPHSPSRPHRHDNDWLNLTRIGDWDLW